jgi:hypothetical protein
MQIRGWQLAKSVPSESTLPPKEGVHATTARTESLPTPRVCNRARNVPKGVLQMFLKAERAASSVQQERERTVSVRIAKPANFNLNEGKQFAEVARIINIRMLPKPNRAKIAPLDSLLKKEQWESR